MIRIHRSESGCPGIVFPLCLSLFVMLAAARAQEQPPSGFPDMEAGLLEVDDEEEWRSARFAEPFAVLPVVVTGPVSAHGDTSAVLEVANVTSEGFQYRALGTGGRETFSYLAMEPGVHEVGGLRWEARLLGGGTLSQGYHRFSQAFRNKPVVLTQFGGGRPLPVTKSSSRAFAFDAPLDVPAETLATAGFVAVETGLGRDADWLMVSGRETDLEGNAWHDIALPLELKDLLFVARLQDSGGARELRHRFLVRDGVTVGFQTLPLVDGETGDVCYLILGGISGETETDGIAGLVFGPDVGVESDWEKQGVGMEDKTVATSAGKKKPGPLPRTKSGSGLEAGLVVHHLMEGTGAVLVDATANGHDGQLFGTTREASGDADRQQVIYHAGSSYTRMDHGALDGQTDLTVSMWFKNGNTSSTAQTWFSAMKDVSYYAIDFWIDSRLDLGELAVATNHDKTSKFGISHAAWFDDQWHHMAVVRDQANQEVKLYFDGSLVGTRTTYTNWSGEHPLNMQALNVGADGTTLGNRNGTAGPPNAWTGFRGRLDGVRVYDRTLSAGEISQLFQGSGPPPPPPPNPDSDGDGLLDAWEWNHLFTLYYDGTDDPDDDGLDNETEESAGSNPNDPYVPPPPPAGGAGGPVVRYKFEGSSATVVDDETGNHPGEIHGAVRTTDPGKGGVIKTAPWNDFIRVPHEAMDGLDNLTVSWWLKSTTTRNLIYMFHSGKNGGSEFVIYRHNDLFIVMNAGKGSVFSMDFGNVLFDGQWHHVVVVRDAASDEIRLHIDGQLFGETGDYRVSGVYYPLDLQPLSVTEDETAISAQLTSAGAPRTYYEFHGEVDDFQLYDRVLGEQEVATLNQGLAVTGGAVDPLTDTDGDGLPDAWEEEHGFDPDDADSDDNNLDDGEEDPDGDGFTNYVEYVAGTDPNDANSVPDTGADGFEVYTQFEE